MMITIITATRRRHGKSCSIFSYNRRVRDDVPSMANSYCPLYVRVVVTSGLRLTSRCHLQNNVQRISNVISKACEISTELISAASLESCIFFSGFVRRCTLATRSSYSRQKLAYCAMLMIWRSSGSCPKRPSEKVFQAHEGRWPRGPLEAEFVRLTSALRHSAKNNIVCLSGAM